jgi:hypothetical protein
MEKKYIYRDVRLCDQQAHVKAWKLLQFSEIWSHVVWCMFSNASEELTASMLRAVQEESSWTTLNNEASRYYETLVPRYQYTRRHIPQDWIIHQYYCVVMSATQTAALEKREIKRFELHVKCPTLLSGMNKNGICPKILVNPTAIYKSLHAVWPRIVFTDFHCRHIKNKHMSRVPRSSDITRK